MTDERVAQEPTSGDSEVLLTVTDLKKYFPIKEGVFRRHVGDVKAVDGVSFEIVKGETFGLVGESGSGKSTIGRVMLQLDDATEGSIVFDGNELTEIKQADLVA